MLHLKKLEEQMKSKISRRTNNKYQRESKLNRDWIDNLKNSMNPRTNSLKR